VYDHTNERRGTARRAGALLAQLHPMPSAPTNARRIGRALPYFQRIEDEFAAELEEAREQQEAATAEVPYEVALLALHLMTVPLTAKVLGWRSSAQALGWQPNAALYLGASVNGVLIGACEHGLPVTETLFLGGQQSEDLSRAIDVVYAPALGLGLLTVVLTLAIMSAAVRREGSTTAKRLGACALAATVIAYGLPSVVGVAPPTNAATLRTFGTASETSLLSPWRCHALSKVVGLVMTSLIYAAAMAARKPEVKYAQVSAVSPGRP
jgi:hypothetical protein